MARSESQGRAIIVDLYDLVEEETVAQCGPFATREEAAEFTAAHVDKVAVFERLRSGYLPEPGSFVAYLEKRATARAAAGEGNGDA